MIKKNQTIIVTGANGLVGSALMEHLRNEMYTSVIGLTRKDVDLTDYYAVQETFRRIQPRHVFHAAAEVYGLGGNMANQGRSILNNTLINTHVIDACKGGSVRKITMMGTNAIYPEHTRQPYTEAAIFDGRPHAGEAGYGHAKRHALAMLEAYQQSYGLEYTYLVSGNLYGPRDCFNSISGHVLPSLIAKFAHAKTTGGEVEVWGDGTQTRDFLYSKDLARAAHLLMSEDLKPGPINVGSGVKTDIDQIVQTLCIVSGVSRERVRFDNTKPVGRKDTFSDLSHIQALGFKPEYDMETGLAETWEWFLQRQRGDVGAK